MKEDVTRKRLFRVVGQNLVLGGQKVKKYYASNVRLSTENIDDLLERAQVGSMQRTQIKYAWDVIREAAVQALEAGHAVHLDGLGFIDITCTSELFDRPEEVTPEKVHSKRVVIRASRQLSKGIEAIKYVDVDKL